MLEPTNKDDISVPFIFGLLPGWWLGKLSRILWYGILTGDRDRRDPTRISFAVRRRVEQYAHR